MTPEEMKQADVKIRDEIAAIKAKGDLNSADLPKLAELITKGEYVDVALHPDEFGIQVND